MSKKNMLKELIASDTCFWIFMDLSRRVSVILKPLKI